MPDRTVSKKGEDSGRILSLFHLVRGLSATERVFA